MSSWVKGAGGRRPPPNPNGGVKSAMHFRRPPYPVREERKEAHAESLNYENSDQQSDYPGTAEYQSYDHPQHPGQHQPHQPNGSPKRFSAGEKRNVLYQRFCKLLQGEEAVRPADCVLLSVNNQNQDYAKSLGHCLQERGLLVEMLYLQAETGLTRALQDVRSNGSPLCILVEQTNVALSSCTVIIFSESLKIHRNMPKEQALDFVMVEFGRVKAARREPAPAEVAAQAAELTDDYLERVKLERHAVPPATRHLLLLVAEGLHLYPEELDALAQYLRTRQEQLQVSSADMVKEAVPDSLSSLTPGLGKPPPLLPSPSVPGPPPRERPTPAGMGDHPSSPMMGTTGSYPKTKPPPLLSLHQGPLHRPPGPHGPLGPHGHLSHGPPPPRGPPAPRGPPPAHGPPPPGHGPRGFPPQRGPLPHHGPPLPRGPLMSRGPPSQNGPHGPQPPRGPRMPPPSLKSLHMGSPPGGPSPRAPRHHLS